MLTAALLAFALASPAQEPPPFDAAARVREAIGVVRPVAYRSAHVDWAALEVEMLAQADGARDTADMLPAYQTLVAGLGDGHSFIQPPPAVMATWRERHGDRAFRPDLASGRDVTSAFHARSDVSHRDVALTPRRHARLVVAPAFAGNAQGARAEAYADALFNAVAEAPPSTCGYILDLRGNVGGNIWPMLTGLSGLLGDGPQGLFRDAQGRDTAFARLRDGQAVIAEGDAAGTVMSQAPAWRPLPERLEAPVAVLIDDATASSGEGVALAFVGRPATRSFGGRTYGVASANDGFPLSDGVNLVITVAMMRDRDGRTYPQGLSPDQPVPHGEGAPEDPDDAVVEAARAWLSALPGCAG